MNLILTEIYEDIWLIIIQVKIMIPSLRTITNCNQIINEVHLQNETENSIYVVLFEIWLRDLVEQWVSQK